MGDNSLNVPEADGSICEANMLIEQSVQPWSLVHRCHFVALRRWAANSLDILEANVLIQISRCCNRA